MATLVLVLVVMLLREHKIVQLFVQEQLAAHARVFLRLDLLRGLVFAELRAEPSSCSADDHEALVLVAFDGYARRYLRRMLPALALAETFTRQDTSDSVLGAWLFFFVASLFVEAILVSVIGKDPFIDNLPSLPARKQRMVLMRGRAGPSVRDERRRYLRLLVKAFLLYVLERIIFIDERQEIGRFHDFPGLVEKRRAPRTRLVLHVDLNDVLRLRLLLLQGSLLFTRGRH